jgi:hypothetical protein
VPYGNERERQIGGILAHARDIEEGRR